jgi:uncharacterized membrane protein YhaH (DUF805 family)
MSNIMSMDGRASRKEYASLFALYVVLQAVALSLVAAIPLVGLVLGFGSWGLMITAACRRSQDCGRSRWFVLIPFYVIWLFFEPGQVGENRFGADPRNPVSVQS